MQFMIPRLRLDNCLVHSTINQKDHNYSTALMITPEIIVAANLYSDDPLLATRKFRRLLLRGESDSIIKVIQIGIVPKFVEFLQRDKNPALQFEAAWILMTIASGTSSQTKTILEAESVPNLIRLLYSENEDLRDISVCALGNIAGNSPECRDYVLDQGILNPLLQLFKKSTRISMTRNAVWALSNLCKGENPAPKFEQISPCLPVLSHLLFYTDAEVLASACWALSYISDGPENIQAVIETGVCERLVELLMRDSPIVISAALEAVGNIVTGNEDQIQLILDCNALLYLLQLLNTTKEETRKVCWTISNIAAGGRQKIQAIIDVNIVPALLKIFSCADFRTKKEAIWTIENLIAGASPEQVSDLVNRNCIPSLCDLLTIADNEIIQVALDSLENILRQGEQIAEVTGGVNPYAVLIEKCCGLDKIENLQLHENTKIYRKAFDMIGNYFGTEKEYAAIDHKDNVGSEQFNASDDICQWIYIIPETIY